MKVLRASALNHPGRPALRGSLGPAAERTFPLAGGGADGSLWRLPRSPGLEIAGAGSVFTDIAPVNTPVNTFCSAFLLLFFFLNT